MVGIIKKFYLYQLSIEIENCMEQESALLSLDAKK